MGLKISIDITGLSAAFEKAPEILERELAKGMKKGLTIIQRAARKKHRFMTLSGDLEKSVQTLTKNVLKEGAVILDRGIAVYGGRIHRGFGTWKADPFLTRAAKRKEPEVVNEINKAVAIGIFKAGF